MQFQRFSFQIELRPRFTQPTFVGLGLRFVSVVEGVEEGMEAARTDAYLGSGQFR